MIASFELRNIFHGKNIFVTGHTGFKGSWLSALLLELGAVVYGFSLDRPKNKKHIYYDFNLEERVLRPNPSEEDYDLVTPGILDGPLDSIRPEYIFHLAGQSIVSKSYLHPAQTFLTNSVGTMNVLESIRNSSFGVTSIFVTSDKCYLNSSGDSNFSEEAPMGGDDPYSASKACAELIYKAYSESFSSLHRGGIASVRAGNVFGGGDWSENRLIPDIMQGILENKIVKLRMPNATRPWTYVLDIVYGYLQLAAHLKQKTIPSGQSWNFASGEMFTVKDIAESLITPFEDVSIICNATSIGKEVEQLQISADKVFKYFQWQPKKEIRVRLEETAEWYKMQSLKTGSHSTSNIMLNEYLK